MQEPRGGTPFQFVIPDEHIKSCLGLQIGHGGPKFGEDAFAGCAVTAVAELVFRWRRDTVGSGTITKLVLKKKISKMVYMLAVVVCASVIYSGRGAILQNRDRPKIANKNRKPFEVFY